MALKKHIRITKEYTVHLSPDEVTAALRRAYPDIPDTAEFTLCVPSGGDYSGDSLQLYEFGSLTATRVDTTERDA